MSVDTGVLTPSLTVHRFTAVKAVFFPTEAEKVGEKLFAPGVGMAVDPDRCAQVHV
jgi:hypothetical protein